MVEKSLYLVRQTLSIIFFYVQKHTCMRNMIRKTNMFIREWAMAWFLVFTIYENLKTDKISIN